MMRLPVIIWLLLAAPVWGNELDVAPCQESPSDDCVIALALQAIESGSAFQSGGDHNAALAEIYIEQGQFGKAEQVMLGMPPSPARAELQQRLALNYHHANKTDGAVRVLTNKINEMLQFIDGNQCMVSLRQQYQAAALAAHLASDQQDVAALPALHKTLKMPVTVAQVEFWLDKEREDKATTLIESIQAPAWRAQALIRYALYRLRNASADTVVAEISPKLSEQQRKEFLSYDLPMELVRLDDLKQALKWAHRVEELDQKVSLFHAMAEAYMKRDNMDRAGRVLTFARDITNNIDDPYKRGMALKTIGSLLVKAGHPNAGRAVFGQALTEVSNVSFLPKRLSGYISIVELEKHVGEEKGARMHVMELIRSGIFKEVDAYGKAGEITRLMHVLDRLVSPHDVMLVVQEIIPIEDDIIRGRLIRKVAQWRMSDRIKGDELNVALLNRTRLAIDSHLNMFERTRLYLIVALAMLQRDWQEEALKDVARARQTLSGPIVSKLPAAAINRYMARSYRQLARASLVLEGVSSARQDLQEADRYMKGDDDPKLMVPALLDHGGVDVAVKRYGMQHVMESLETAQQVIPVIHMVEQQSSKPKDVLVTMLEWLAKEKHWEAAYHVVQAIAKQDEGAFMGLGAWLKKPPQHMIDAVIKAHLSAPQPDEKEVLRLIGISKDKDVQSQALLALARHMVGQEQQAKPIEVPELLTLPDDYAYRSCGMME